MSINKTHKSVRGRRTMGHPFNLMVSGHSHTGKSSFIQTLIESLDGRKIMSDSAAAAASAKGSAEDVSSSSTPTSPLSPPPPAPAAGIMTSKTPVLLSAIFPGADITAPTPVKAR
ncbi:hypothetical protein HDU67_002712, partial [Dinochytrium kinnereticum]